MTGAILRRELLAPVRKLRTFFVRGGYGLVLAVVFGIFCLIYQIEMMVSGSMGGSAQSVSALAQRLATSIVTINIVACLLFTPAYMAGAIAQEKAQRTIQDLLLTSMGNTEIVLSKFLGRLAHVALVLATGIPVFAMAALLGGVSASMMAALSAMTLLWLVTTGSFSLLLSVLVRRTRDAILATYTLGAVWLGGTAWASYSLPGWLLWSADIFDSFNPFFVLQPAWTGADIAEMWQRIGVATTVLGTFSACSLGLTVRLLRPLGIQQLVVAASRRNHRWARPDRSPPDERPMLWKEKYFPPSGRIARLTRRLGLVAVAGMLGLVVWLYYLEATTGVQRMDAEAWMQGPRVLAWPLYLSLLLTASSAFSGERERATWDAILASPLDGREIVLGKLWGSIWEVRWWLLAIALATAQALASLFASATTSPWFAGPAPAATSTTTTTATSGSGGTTATVAITIPAGGTYPAATGWRRLGAVMLVFTGVWGAPGTIGLAGEVFFLLGLGLRTSLACRNSGKSLAITLAIWIGSGWLLGIVTYLIIFLGAMVFFWWTRGGSATTPVWGISLFNAASWGGPLASGLFWSGLGLGLIYWTMKRFDELASRMHDHGAKL